MHEGQASATDQAIIDAAGRVAQATHRFANDRRPECREAILAELRDHASFLSDFLVIQEGLATSSRLADLLADRDDATKATDHLAAVSIQSGGER